MREYQALATTRDETVDNVGPWYWLATDKGAWDGPKSDWETSHKPKILQYVEGFGTVLQAGGNQGMYPVLYSKMFAKVYTFEPDPLNFYFLVNNAQFDNIFKMQAALGAEHKMVSLARPSLENTGMHTISHGAADNTICNIPMLMVDDFQFENLNLMHLDVEGYEANILRGALKTIEKHHPVIFAENGNPEIHQILAPFGYIERDTSCSDKVYVRPK